MAKEYPRGTMHGTSNHMVKLLSARIIVSNYSNDGSPYLPYRRRDLAEAQTEILIASESLLESNKKSLARAQSTLLYSGYYRGQRTSFDEDDFWGGGMSTCSRFPYELTRKYCGEYFKHAQVSSRCP